MHPAMPFTTLPPHHTRLPPTRPPTVTSPPPAPPAPRLLLLRAARAVQGRLRGRPDHQGRAVWSGCGGQPLPGGRRAEGGVSGEAAEAGGGRGQGWGGAGGGCGLTHALARTPANPLAHNPARTPATTPAHHPTPPHPTPPLFSCCLPQVPIDGEAVPKPPAMKPIPMAAARLIMGFVVDGWRGLVGSFWAK